jgi:hypothetical protein
MGVTLIQRGWGGDMPDDLYFEGDPALDSRRRHLERVLKGGPPRRRWPWILAAVAGGGAWALWRAGRRPQADGAEQPGPADTTTPDK